MILIISIDTDASTTHVVRWLLFRKTEVLRVNAGSDQACPDVVNELSFTIGDQDTGLLLHLGHTSIAYSEIEAYWYRRGGLLSSIPPEE